MYDVPFTRITVIGQGSNSLEGWSFNLCATPASVGVQATADALAPIVQNWFTNAGMIFSSEVKLTEIKVANIETTGLYPSTAVPGAHFFVPAVPGTYSTGGAQQYLIPQSSVAVTLVTAKPRGLASKGRIYLPPQGIVLVNGQIQVSHAQGFATLTAQMIQAINADPLVGNVSVMSKGKGVKDNPAGKKIHYNYPTVGTHELVTGVRVGRVVDTQRRRRRSIPEVPVAAPLA